MCLLRPGFRTWSQDCFALPSLMKTPKSALCVLFVVTILEIKTEFKKLLKVNIRFLLGILSEQLLKRVAWFFNFANLFNFWFIRQLLPIISGPAFHLLQCCFTWNVWRTSVLTPVHYWERRAHSNSFFSDNCDFSSRNHQWCFLLY